MRDRFDWQRINERLQAAQEAYGEALHPSAASIERVYRERAAFLVERHAQRAVRFGLNVVICEVGNERVAFEAHELCEIQPFRGCTVLPRAPRELLGVVSQEGEICMVADLGRLLSTHGEGTSTGGYLLRLRRHLLALRVDRVDRLQGFDEAEIVTPGGEGTALRFARGATADGLLIVSVARLLEHEAFGARRPSVAEG
jgi:chemotaxis signal transduction protein